MSRVIISPVKRWPGTVTLADPVNYRQLAAWQNAVADAMEGRAALTVGDVLTQAQLAAQLLPGVLACVENWSLAGPGWPDVVTLESFPATPQVASARLLAWLIGEISTIIGQADDIPND